MCQMSILLLNCTHIYIYIRSISSCLYTYIYIYLKVGCPPPESGCFLVMEQWLRFSLGRGKNLPVEFHTCLDAFGFTPIYFMESFGLCCLIIDQNKTNPSPSQSIWGHRILLTAKASVSEHSRELAGTLFLVRSPSLTLPHQPILMLSWAWLLFW